MQSGLDPTDRKLLLGAAALAFLMAVGSVALAPPDHGSNSKVPSSYSSASAGARAAYLLLQDLHYPIRRWEEPPAHLADVSHHAVLILAEPTQMPSPGERASLLKFVLRGGRILFCGDGLKAFFRSAPVARSSPGREWTQFSSDLPAAFTRGARTITMEPKSSWTKLNTRQFALYGDKAAPVVVAWRFGSGELLWWAAPTPLTNAGISQTGNLTLFLNAVSAFPTEAPLNVYWDEYFHGVRGSLWAYIEATPLKWALVQFALIISGLLFAFSRRWGPVATPRSASRLSPLEFVDTLGGLYQRAGATSVATGVAYRHLRRHLARRLALPFTIPDLALAHAAGERLGWDPAHLTATLEKATIAEGHNLRPREALNLVQDIGRYAMRLRTRRAPLENN